MLRVHNSSTSAQPRPQTAPSGVSGAGLQELCTRAGHAALRAGRAVRWYVTSLMGDTAYATYLAHHGRAHPGEPALTERQFWRERMDDQDRNPGARCC